MSITCIIFDFDGTLADTNEIKLSTFYTLFDDAHAEVVADVMEGYGLLSRYQIIEQVLRRTGFDETGIEKEIERLADLYNTKVVPATILAPAMPGVVELLDSLKGRYSIYLSSMTPQEPVRQVVEGRGWSHYFKGVYGWPNKKSDTARKVMAAENIKPENMVIVGDGKSDEESALEVGCSFIRIEHDCSPLLEMF